MAWGVVCGVVVGIASGCTGDGGEDCPAVDECQAADALLGNSSISTGLIVTGAVVNDVETECSVECRAVGVSFGMMEGTAADAVLTDDINSESNWKFGADTVVEVPTEAGTYTVCTPTGSSVDQRPENGVFEALCSEVEIPEDSLVLATVRHHFTVGLAFENEDGSVAWNRNEDIVIAVELR